MNEIRVPPYLKKGDCIGITCPAGALEYSAILPMISQCEQWGFKVKIGQTVGTHFHKFSATDIERTQDIQSLLDDETVNAILFGRGGYGLVRIIDSINFEKFKKKPKWLLGYSDITCILHHVYNKFQISTIHAHMSAGYMPHNMDAFSTQTIVEALSGNKIEYPLVEHTLNRKGNCCGEITGGNLALISDLIGTPDEIDTENKILFIEDIGEYLYNIDRMMWQLKRSGKLTHLKALLVGGFTDCLDNDISFGMNVYEIIYEKVREYNYPVYFDFPVGHQPQNIALKIGMQYQINQNIFKEK